jgi:hypothetical protein
MTMQHKIKHYNPLKEAQNKMENFIEYFRDAIQELGDQ